MKKMLRWLVVCTVLWGGGFRCAGSDEVAKGHELYQRYCALCHGDDGEGYASLSANALNNADFLASVDDDFLIVAIERGRIGTKMSAFGARYGGPLNDDETSSLIAFLRSKQNLPAADLRTGTILGDAET